MEPRIAKLEALAEATKERMDRLDGRMDRLDGDIRTLMKVLGGGFILTWAAGASAFLYLSNKVDSETAALAAKIDATTGALSGKLDALTVAILEKLLQ